MIVLFNISPVGIQDEEIKAAIISCPMPPFHHPLLYSCVGVNELREEVGKGRGKRQEILEEFTFSYFF